MSHSLQHRDDVLRRFRDWLDQTDDEMESLSLMGACDSPHDDSDALPEHRQCVSLPSVGLMQIVEAFTAMRHEMKLQTKGSRSLESALEQSLNRLESAGRDFRSVQAREQEAGDRAARPVVEALTSLDEGLLRAARTLELTSARVPDVTSFRIRERFDQMHRELPWWKRLFMRRWHAAACAVASDSIPQSVAEELAGLIQGFRQIQLRLMDSLKNLEICRITPSGGQVDPTLMTVIDVVRTPDLPPETVVDVVRPGYTWKGVVVRFAEVRAVAGMRPTPDLPPESPQDPPDSPQELNVDSESE